VLANTTFAPTARAASRTLIVPSTFDLASAAGSATDLRTSICAARWKITSGALRSTASRTASPSATEVVTSSAPAPTRSARPLDRSSTTVTRSPRASTAPTRCDPMNPAPPVTTTRIPPPYERAGNLIPAARSA
jgi:hypothetical protein